MGGYTTRVELIHKSSGLPSRQREEVSVCLGQGCHPPVALEQRVRLGYQHLRAMSSLRWEQIGQAWVTVEKHRAVIGDPVGTTEMSYHRPETPKDYCGICGKALNFYRAGVNLRALSDLPSHVPVSGEQDKEPNRVQHLEALQRAHADRTDLDRVSE